MCLLQQSARYLSWMNDGVPALTAVCGYRFRSGVVFSRIFIDSAFLRFHSRIPSSVVGAVDVGANIVGCVCPAGVADVIGETLIAGDV